VTASRPSETRGDALACGRRGFPRSDQRVERDTSDGAMERRAISGEDTVYFVEMMPESPMDDDRQPLERPGDP
jgi:hypothetical protein